MKNKPIFILLIISIFISLHPVSASEVQPLQIDKEKLADSIKKAFNKSEFNGYVVVSKEGRSFSVKGAVQSMIPLILNQMKIRFLESLPSQNR